MSPKVFSTEVAIWHMSLICICSRNFILDCATLGSILLNHVQLPNILRLFNPTGLRWLCLSYQGLKLLGIRTASVAAVNRLHYARYRMGGFTNLVSLATMYFPLLLLRVILRLPRLCEPFTYAVYPRHCLTSSVPLHLFGCSFTLKCTISVRNFKTLNYA